MGHERRAGLGASLAALFHGAPGAGTRRVRRLRLAPEVGAFHEPGGRCRHHPREPLAVAYLYLLFALWVVNAIDLALTLHWTSDVGWAAEGNRIMRAVAHAGGPLGFALYKLLLMTLVVLLLWWFYLKVEDYGHHARRRVHRVRARLAHGVVLGATLVLAGFYGWVVANNLRVMGII